MLGRNNQSVDKTVDRDFMLSSEKTANERYIDMGLGQVSLSVTPIPVNEIPGKRIVQAVSVTQHCSDFGC